MGDFFKQLISQLAQIWQRLSLQQRIITSAVVGLTFIGMIAVVMWSGGTGGAKAQAGGYRVLYSDLPIKEASVVTEELENQGYDYQLRNQGTAVLVKKKQLYQARMDLAREGLPQSHGVGYEIFDKPNIAMSDFVQKLNARRALEGELERTIGSLSEVDDARVHIVKPKESVFTERQKDTKASVVIRPRIGKELASEQIKGISFLVSSSVEGLETKNISIVSASGKLLSSQYKQDETALVSSRNLQLQHKVESYLEKKAQGLLYSVVGSDNARIRIAADLNFDEVNRTLERYDPEGKVVRSEERNSKETTNAPTGDHEQERSITNYEINKTMEHVVKEVGNINRLSISVVVDGKYVDGEEEKPQYESRSPEEIQKLSDMVKNAVGYSLERGDEFNLTNIKFDRMHLQQQQRALAQQQQQEFIMMLVKYGVILLLGIMVLLLIRYVANTVKDAMNPPIPEVPELQREEDVEEVPEEMQRSSELLEKVEMMSHESPSNVSAIISNWLKEGYSQNK